VRAVLVQVLVFVQVLAFVQVLVFVAVRVRVLVAVLPAWLVLGSAAGRAWAGSSTLGRARA
jgi:hypothetical protein